MSNLPTIRKFEYRLCRIKIGFNVDFIVEGLTYHGICKDISNKGIRAEFDVPLAVGSSGLLIFRPSTRVLTVAATVAYTRNRQTGLVFANETPLGLEATTEVID